MILGRGKTNHLYVDVDGTLLIWPPPGKPGGPTAEQSKNLHAMAASSAGSSYAYLQDPALLPKVNERLVAEIRKWRAAGGILVIWSMGGAQHAEAARFFCGLGVDDGVICIGKPDLAVDDNPNVWGKGRVLVASPDTFKVPE